MARFFITASNIFGGIAYIKGEDTARFKSLRIRQGEAFTLCDGAGTDYTCVLSSITPDGVEAEITGSCPSLGEPTVDCTVYAAFLDGDKLEHVVQKAVELGASAIKLFPSHRCISRLEGLALVKKTAGLQKASNEAAKQWGRGRIPQVLAMPSFKSAIDEASKAELPIFCYEEERNCSLKHTLEQKQDAKTISIVTGPENGFEPDEAAYAVQCGMVSVTMGSRILGCETAPLCALSAVMLFTGNL